MTMMPEKPSDQLREAIKMSREICTIFCRGIIHTLGAETVNEMTDEEVLVQAVNICNVFMQEEYDNQVSVVPG